MRLHAPFSRWTVLIVALAVVLVVFLNLGGERYRAARSYVLQSQEIRGVYGDIRWYFPYSARLSMSSSAGSYLSRGSYRFYISGSVTSGSVYVRVDDLNGSRKISWE